MNLKQSWRNIRPYLVSGLIYRFVSTLGATYRIRTLGYDRFLDIPGGKILAGWHGRVVLGPVLFRNLGFWALISHSKDGDMQNRIFHAFGFQTIRGSTGRGGMKALVECIRVLKAGGTIAFTPDGPRGPSGVVQMGIIKMAQKSGVPIIPGAASADRRWLFNSWDRYMVPKPFANCLVVFGNPVYIPENATEEQLEALRQGIEKEMHRLEALAEAEYSHPAPAWHSAEAQTGR